MVKLPKTRKLPKAPKVKKPKKPKKKKHSIRVRKQPGGNPPPRYVRKWIQENPTEELPDEYKALISHNWLQHLRSKYKAEAKEAAYRQHKYIKPIYHKYKQGLVLVEDNYPHIDWIDGQQNFSRRQRHWIYESALTLTSRKRIATSMGADHATFNRVFEANPEVVKRYERIKELVLQDVSGQVVQRALKGDAHMMLRVLGAHGIFRDTQVVESTNINKNVSAVVTKETSMEELQDVYTTILLEDSDEN